MTKPYEAAVVICFDPLSADGLYRLTKGLAPEAVVDPHLSRMAGAVCVAGHRPGLERFSQLLTSTPIHRSVAQHPNLTYQQQAWLAYGERGASSEAIFSVIFDVNLGSYLPTPSDPADLRRCRLLLESIPGAIPLFKARMPLVSPAWQKLVAAWDEICALMDLEAPSWRTNRCSAPRTYEAMNRLA